MPKPRGALAYLLSLFLSCLLACGRAAPSPASDTSPTAPIGRGPSSTASTIPPVAIEMKNVHLHVDAGIVLDVRELRGQMISRRPNQPPVFDDQASYVLQVDRARLSLDMTSLDSLMNDHLFQDEGAPLSKVRSAIGADGRLEQHATLHKGVSVPVAMKSSVSAAPDGRLRLHVESLQALHVPVQGLLALFGLKVENLVDLEKRRGVTVQDNDVLIDVGQVLPPPMIRGRLSNVALENGQLVQTFESAGPPLERLSPPDPRASGYIYFSGSEIRFGKLTMHDADLQLIDADPADPFDFYPARYSAQLVAGYSKNTPSGGLRTYMPDYGDLQRRPSIDLRPTPARRPHGRESTRP